MRFKHFPEKTPLRILTAPFILFMFVPLLLLDICLEIYHRICFPIYGIPFVRRGSYIRMGDRHKLPYLKGTEKVFCAYCGYANGLLQYAVTVAGETEKYWCGIKHQQSVGFIEPAHHKDFLPYGDKEALDRYVEEGLRLEDRKRKNKEALPE